MANRLLFLLLPLALAAPPVTVDYYYGREVRTALDGRIPYGDSHCVLKREVEEGGARIVETTTEPGHSPSMPASTSVRELKRRGTSLVYDAVEDHGAFTGTVTFIDAHLNQWQCDFKRREGGSLKGNVERSQKGIRTHYTLVLPNISMLLEGTLEPVSAREYEREEASMHPRRGAE